MGVKWTFLSNHAHVLICIGRDPECRIRDLAGRVGITERAVQRVLHDLIADGYVCVQKKGRRNLYSIDFDRPMRHPVEEGWSVGKLLEFVEGPHRTAVDS